MFDGTFKTGRKVNLSGRKKSTYGSHTVNTTAGAGLSKEELLQQTKRLREERQVQRQRTVASTKIQAIYRRIATTRRVRVCVFQDLENELSALVGPNGAPPTTPVETGPLQSIVRKFLVAYGHHGHDLPTVRLANAQNYVFVMLLVSALQGTTRDVNILSMSKDATWVYQLTRVLEIALRIVVNRDDHVADQVRSVCMVLIETLTTRDRYIAAKALDTDEMMPKLLSQLARTDGFGTFDALQRLVQNHTKNDDRVAQIVVQLAVRSLESVCSESSTETLRKDVLAQFAKKIVLTPGALSCPLVQRVMQGVGTAQTNKDELWGTVLSVLYEDDNHTSPLSWREAAIAIGNVLDLFAGSGFAPTIVEQGVVVLARLVTTSHIRWAFDIEKSLLTSSTEDVDMDDEDNLTARTQTQLILEATDTDEDRDIIEREITLLAGSEREIKTQWQQLCDSTFVRRLFDAFGSSLGLQHLSRVYATLLLGLGRAHLLSVRQSFKLPPPAFATVLSAVSNQPLDGLTGIAVVKRLWELVHASSPSISSAANRRMGDAVLQPLLLFNAIYSHMLLTLDDETFYDRAWPFTLTEISSIVVYLKQFIFDVCWNVNVNTRSSATETLVNPHLFPAITTSVKLFNQLYDRDCRRRFTADGAWLWPSMPAIRETVDLESMEGDLFELQALASLMSSNASLTPHARASLILTTIPQVFSFNDRVLLFEKLLDEEKRNLEPVRGEFSRAIQVRVQRNEIVDDSFELFQKVCELQSPSALKSRIKVTFVNEQGLEEAGIDGGGVFKEYIDQLTKQAFSPEYGFFLATNEQLLYPNPAARLLVDTAKDMTDRFRFLGRVLGKAVFENILVEPQFAAFFLNKLLGKYNYIDDLHSLDPDLYRNLMLLKHYSDNVEDLALTFSVSEIEFGQAITRELIPGGANIPVTNDNRIRYIHLLANYKLNVLSSHESAAFLRGFRDLIPAKWIQMFSPSELQMLIGGQANKIDVLDWQRHTTYGGGYHPSQRPIQWFWDLVTNEFSADDRAALLKFITSVSRQPLLGFSQLAPQICIHQVRIDDDERLPSSATCMNLLKLPTYSSKAIMKRKLLYAIRANAGFDLS